MIVLTYASDPPGSRHFADAAASLEQQCRDLDLPFVLQRPPDLGSWARNCWYKPDIILSALERHPVVLWMDADSRIVADPRPMLDATLAGRDAVFVSADRLLADAPEDRRRLRIMDYTHGWAATAGARRFLSGWAQGNRSRLLHQVLAQQRQDPSVRRWFRQAILPEAFETVVQLGLTPCALKHGV